MTWKAIGPQLMRNTLATAWSRGDSMSGDSTGADEGTRVVETDLIRARREQRQETEPYQWPLVIVFWCAGAFVLIRIVEWPVVTMTDTAIVLIWVGLTAYLTWFVARAPRLARLDAISPRDIQLSMRGPSP